MGYQRGKKQGPLLRAVVVICGLAVLVSGVTFAALTSQNALLQGSTITSATANLLIGDGIGGFLASTHGYAFTGVEPGGAPAPKVPNILQLKNSGTSELALRVMMNPNSIMNPQNVNLDRVYLTITPVDGSPAQQIAFSTLLAAYTSGTPVSLNKTLPGGQVGQYGVQIQMAGDSVSNTLNGVSVAGIDLIFSGTSVVS